jgi:phosphoenolpyruvate synthase/pyruvate phosphate dikinase
MESIRDFKNLNKSNVDIAGGKGASLGEMTQAGISVPPGFVILSDAFEQFLGETDLNVEIDTVLHSVDHEKMHTVEDASEKIKALILNSEIPEDVAEEIRNSFKKLDAKYVAVRSSATAEDSASAAWAGQLDSYLNTTTDNLLENIKNCWASLFTPRAIFYRFEKCLDKQKISVAVVVQKMVESEVSGIAFSVHPVTEDKNQLIIEAGLGLGEAIVSGAITPDSYVIEKDPRRIIDKNVHTQTRGLFRAKKGGNEWHDISKKEGGKQVLNDKQILELSGLIIHIENHYGFPVDIEWAFEGGEFHITQSRPITTLALQAKPADEKKDYVFMWSSKPLLPSFYATPWAVKERTDVYQSADVFQYYDGEIITAYMPMQDLNKFRAVDSPKYLNPQYFKKYQEKYKKETKDWWEYIRRVEKTDYDKISKKQLIKDHYDFVAYNRDAISYFGSTRTEFTHATERQLENIIKKHYGNKWPDVFGDLTTSPDYDDVQKEYIDWLNLIIKRPTDIQLLEHVSVYPWLVIGEFSEQKVIEYLRKRAKEEKETFAEKTKEQQKNKKELKRRQETIYKKLGDDKKEAQYLAILLQIQSVERMNIKSYWGGSYYLARNMWHKVASELDLGLWDILLYISPPETQQLLKGTYKGDLKKVLSLREKSYAINYEVGGEITMLEGKAADAMFKEKIHIDVEGITKIEGQAAALGKYTGKVRKVMPGDLEMLKSDIKNFKKGEVLVTSMTQPNMMVIAEKAGAIVADEGGITSHAAIIARELKIPCIVGCFFAMEALEDGDLVEVDANNSVVKILEKK